MAGGSAAALFASYNPVTRLLAVSYRDYVTTAATQSSFTYTSRDIGSNTSHPDRKAYVLVQSTQTANDLTLPSGVTVGGVSGSQVAANATRNVLNSTNLFSNSSIWEVNTTGLGSTANVVVTFGSNQTRCTIAVYEALDAVLIDADQQYDSSVAAPDGVSITLDTQSPGAIIALGMGLVNGAPSASGFTARQNNQLVANTESTRDYSIILGDDLAPAVSSDSIGVSLGGDSRAQIVGISLAQAT